MRAQIIGGGFAVALALAAAWYVSGDGNSADPSTAPSPAASPAASGDGSRPAASGVEARDADTPSDLRERARERDEDEVERNAEPEVAPTPPPDDRDRNVDPGPPPTAVGPPGSPTVEAAMAAATIAAQAAADAARKQIRKECWDTIEHGHVGAGGVEIGMSLSFGADGQVLASSVDQGREDYVQGLETCVGPIAHAIVVPPPGEPVSVSVSVRLP